MSLGVTARKFCSIGPWRSQLFCFVLEISFRCVSCSFHAFVNFECANQTAANKSKTERLKIALIFFRFSPKRASFLHD